ncbi:MAG: rhodanese-like domain-containing protein [Clostridiales bacterium]|nr:rhodanese-like domain-containing protein [Clostridiales bacterium]
MKRRLLIFTLLPLLALGSCARDNTPSLATPPVYQKISANDAKQIMDSGEEYILLDVRTEEEFAEGHIKGAILIPDYELADRAETELPNKDARILIYCRSGRRSANAANALIELGYTNVYDFGGIIDWPFETVGG